MGNDASMDREETQELGRGEIHAHDGRFCLEVKMNPFSRSFMRKRAIQLATTALVAAMSFALAQDPMKVFHVRGAMPIQYVADRPDYAAEGPFLAENDAAMSKMMADMTIKPTGDIDRDFVAMMAPHHQGAVEMAKAELEYGHNEQLRRLAQKIVVSQQQEIAVMRLAIGEKLPASAASPMQPGATALSITPDEATPANGRANQCPHR
jgi:hypothetical protein